MLSRAAGRSLLVRSLQAPAARSTTASFRIATSTQWTRSLATNRRGGSKKPVDYSRTPGSPGAPRSSSIGQQSTGAGAAFAASRSAPTSKEQAESSQKASQDQNTAPQSSGNASKQAVSEAEEPAYTGPLPDLTQGIPSTLEFEAIERARQTEGSELNVTEDPAHPGGRPRGELPASAYVSSSEKKRLRVANYMYLAFAAFSVTAYTFLGRNWESEEEEKQHHDAPSGWSFTLMWARAKARLGDQLSYYHEPAFRKLLPDPDPSFERPYTLVLSLEDLLIHSEWTREHGWRMAKRPGVDYFLRYLSQYYELVIFTSVPWAIGEPVVRKLDPYHIITWPLYREATMYKNGEYVKDLSYLNRDLSKVILLDTVAGHAREQPENSIILKKWEGDAKDKELVSLIPFLEYIPTMATGDVRKAIKSFDGTHIPTEFAAREAVARKKFHSQMAEERAHRPKSGLGFLSNALGVKPQPMMEGEQSAAEAFSQGKMLQDQARERGQRNYEALEKMIREEGEKWLKEEAAHEEMAKQEGMKAMKSGLTGFFGVPSGSEKPQGS